MELAKLQILQRKIVHNKTHNKKARMKGKSTSPHPFKNSKKA